MPQGAGKYEACFVFEMAKHGEIGGGHSRVDNVNSERVKGGTSEMAKHGENEHSKAGKKLDQVDIVNLVKGGNAQSYLARRLESGGVLIWPARRSWILGRYRGRNNCLLTL